MERKYAVCFTGHRSFQAEDCGILLLKTEQLVRAGYLHFFAGGAKGFDSRAAQCVLYLRDKYPQIMLHLILPCEKELQTKGWSREEIDLYEYLRQNADTVEVLPTMSEKHYGDMMRRRNRALVDSASYCVCWYDEGRARTGTGQTVRMAQQAGLQICNLLQLKKQFEAGK